MGASRRASRSAPPWLVEQVYAALWWIKENAVGFAVVCLAAAALIHWNQIELKKAALDAQRQALDDRARLLTEKTEFLENKEKGIQARADSLRSKKEALRAIETSRGKRNDGK